MAEQATFGEQGQQANQGQGQQANQGQGQQGGETDGIGSAASQAYGEALEGGASPQEAFEASRRCSSRSSNRNRSSSSRFRSGNGSCFGLVLQMQWLVALSPGEAFGSAMEAAQEATDPGTDMGPPPYVRPNW